MSPVKTTETETIKPLFADPRFDQLLAREEALAQRLEAVRAESRKPRPDPMDAWVTALTGDPAAALSAPSPTADQAGQIEALGRAITAVQQESHRLRRELSRELAERMRPARAARARALAAALESAIGAITEDVAAHREILGHGYDAPSLLLTAADRDALVRLRDRVHDRQGG